MVNKFTSFILVLLLSFYSIHALAHTNSKKAILGEKSVSINYDDPRPKIRLGFTAVNGLHRQLLLTVDENATAGIDWGYDGEYYETEWDDMYWLLDGLRFTIQGTNIVDETTVFPLGFHTNDDGMNVIKIDELENFYEDLNIYIYDRELDLYHSLREREYLFYADEGVYMDRFDLVFSIPETLGNPGVEQGSFNFFYSNANKNIVIQNPTNKQIDQVVMYNLTGQTVFSAKSNTTFGDQKYNVRNLSTGTYIIVLNTERGILSKKVLVK